MYSLLIVEDEMLPRMALRTMIQKNYSEFSSVWEAEDGEEALKIAREHRPDVLLVDINLPGTTGLELCQALAREGLESHTIITTAYGRFGYVKQAMDLGCQAYLLKPVGDKELDAALKKCFSSMDKLRHADHTAEGLRTMQNYVSPYLMQEFREKGIQPSLLQRGYGWPEEGELSAYYVKLKWKGKTEQGNFPEVLGIWEQALKTVFDMIAETDGNCIRMLLQEKHREHNQPMRTGLWMCTSIAIRRMAETVGERSIFFFSGPHYSYEALNEVFLSETPMITVNGGIEECLDSGLFLGNSSIGKKQKALLRQRIVQRFREEKLERAAAVLQRLEKENFEQMIQILLEALWVFEPELNLSLVWELLPQMENGVPGITRWLQKIWRLMPGNKCGKRQESAVDTALCFLELHYGEMISEAQVAEEVGLSPAYFSRLFKQKTGENFSTVLLNIRLNHVRSLLEEGEDDTALIAKQCGFASARYLDMVFKQFCGMSIAQYRSQKEENRESRDTIKNSQFP